MTRNQKAYLFAALSILFWATVASAFKIALRHVGFFTLLFYSVTTSLLVLFLILLVQGKLRLALQATGREYLFSAFLGLLNPTLYYLILFKAYSLLPAQMAQPLNFTWPIVLVLLSIPINKEKVGWVSAIALLMSFVGVIFIASGGRWFTFDFSEPFGIFLALISSVFWALYWLLNARDKRDPVVKLFLTFLFAFLILLPFHLAFGSSQPVSVSGLLACGYVGVFEMGLTFVFWLKALEYAERTRFISNLIYLTPFFSLLLIRLIIKEEIFVSSLAGLTLIALGIILQKKFR
ncbi:MAG: DMT family transporter [Bacteroidota bacterium]